MKKKIRKKSELIKNDYRIFLNYLKTKFPLFHNSNLFYRDFQFGIKSFLEKKGFDLSYSDSELLADDVSRFFEENKIFIPVDKGVWRMNYPEFVTTKPGDPL